MKIEVWSDIMCPFCYIGKRRLENAIAGFPYKEGIEVEWKSFLLNPDMVTDPEKSTLQYLSETKGWSLEQTKQITAQVVEMAKSEGLHYQMEKTVVANAMNAHRLLQWAKGLGKGPALKERLLKAYFTEGANIDDFDTLLGFAGELGLDVQEANVVLNSEQFADKVQEDIYESRQIGVRGVPFFVLDRKYAISGAQPQAVFDQTIQKAWEGYVLENPILQVEGGEMGDACDIEGNC